MFQIISAGIHLVKWKFGNIQDNSNDDDEEVKECTEIISIVAGAHWETEKKGS